PAGGRLGLLILGGLDFAQQQICNFRVWGSVRSMIGDRAIELQQAFGAGGGVVGIELVLAPGRTDFESMRTKRLGHRAKGRVGVGDIDLICVGIRANVAKTETIAGAVLSGSADGYLRCLA